MSKYRAADTPSIETLARQGMDVAQIAERLGISERGVKIAAGRADIVIESADDIRKRWLLIIGPLKERLRSDLRDVVA